MRKIALLLVLCMLFGLCACSSQPEDLNKSSNPQEAETSQETEGSEEFDPDFMLDMQTLELIMPDGEENRIHQIDVADSTNFYLREENGEESLYECHVSSETFYMIDNSTGTYFEGTYSVSENTITVSVTDYDYGVQPVVNFEKITEFTKDGETDSGYTGSATVVFYDAIRNLEGSFSHPADSSVTVEVPSNEENYYILPFEITVKNTSEGFDAPARLKLTVQENKNIIGGCKDYELPGYISSIVTNVYVRVFYYQNNTWEEDSNDMLPASPYFSETISWDNFAGGKEYKQLGYLLISDVISPKYPDGLPWYIYPNMGLDASLYLDNLHAVAAGVMIMKEDDGSATGRYTVIDATDSEALDAVWAKSEEMLESLEE